MWGAAWARGRGISGDRELGVRDGKAWVLHVVQDDGRGWRGGLGRVVAGAGAVAGGGRARGRCGGSDIGLADRRDGEGAGAPEIEELFQAGEEAGEDGRDQGVKGGREQGARLPPERAGLGGGDRGAEGCMH